MAEVELKECVCVKKAAGDKEEWSDDDYLLGDEKEDKEDEELEADETKEEKYEEEEEEKPDNY